METAVQHHMLSDLTQQATDYIQLESNLCVPLCSVDLSLGHAPCVSFERR